MAKNRTNKTVTNQPKVEVKPEEVKEETQPEAVVSEPVVEDGAVDEEHVEVGEDKMLSETPPEEVKVEPKPQEPEVADTVNKSETESKEVIEDGDTGDNFLKGENLTWEDAWEAVKQTSDVNEILAILQDSENLDVRIFVGYIVDYMKRVKAAKDEVDGSVATSVFYTFMMSIIQTEDEKRFKQKMDIFNLILKDGVDNPDSPFSKLKLLRWSEFKLNNKEVRTHAILVELLTRLCDASTRSENMKSINGFRTSELTTFTEKEVNRIRKYYNMG